MIYAFGFFKEVTVDNYKWFFNKFSEYMREAAGETGDLGCKKTGQTCKIISEARIISAYDMNLATAIEETLKNSVLPNLCPGQNGNSLPS